MSENTEITINLSHKDAALLQHVLVNDLDYYHNGLNTLEKLKDTADPEFSNALREAEVSPSWTRDDVDVRIKNTTKVVNVFENVVEQIEKAIDRTV